jgi:malonyl-CoA/methylmalonyl-CoA synthetase
METHKMDHTSLTEYFSESFVRHNKKTAISFLRDGKLETTLSFIELENAANRMANVFLSVGIEPGDRVILFIDKSLVPVVAHLALQKLGAISVPLNPGFKNAEMAYLLHDAQAKAIVLASDKETFIKEIDPIPIRIVVESQKAFQDQDLFNNASDELSSVDIQCNDPGLIIYTSGTTGQPKGAILTQQNLVSDALNIINIWELSESDTLCHALPLFHVHGLCFALHTALIAGVHVVMLDRFSPRRVIETLSRQTGDTVCTVFMAVPAMYAKLMEHIGDKDINFKHIRLLTSGSAPLLSRDFKRIHDVFGKEPLEREGMSETGMNFSNPLTGNRKPGSIGLPLPAVDVRLVDPDTGMDVKQGQTGEIWLKGPAVTPGYWQKPEETAGVFDAGWFKTGDLGNMDTEGYYYLTDRIKHIIISGGENISPKEIEIIINQMDGILESSVVGIPDDKWGEKAVAAIVKKPGAEVGAAEIQSYCKAQLHSWKCFKAFVFVSELPRNTMGKVLKETVKRFFE